MKILAKNLFYKDILHKINQELAILVLYLNYRRVILRNFLLVLMLNLRVAVIDP